MNAPAVHDVPKYQVRAAQSIERSPRRTRSAPYTLGGKLLGALVVFALAASAAALLLDAVPGFRSEAVRAAVSPASLFLIGTAFIGLQVWLRPGFRALFKRAMIAVAFLLWGVVQLLPPGALAATLGDVVIALFVVDLAIVIRQQTRGDRKAMSLNP